MPEPGDYSPPAASAAPTIEPKGGGNGHPRYAAFPVILKATDNRYSNTLNAAPLTVNAHVANRMDFIPVVFPITFTASTMSVEVTTPVAESTLRFALYGANQETSLPSGTPIYSDASSLSADPAGMKSRTINQLIQGGLLYWVALWTQGAPSFRAVDYQACLPLNIGGAASDSPNTLLRGSAAYAASGTWPSIPTLTPTRSLVPLVRFRDSGY